LIFSKIKRLLILIIFRLRDGHGRYRLAKKIKIFKSIGKGCYLGSYNFGTEPFLISFGNNVVLGTGVRFINHDMSAEMISMKTSGHFERLSIFGEINIGNNVFIGADSIILPGVTIGSNVVIGAGAIISKDIPGDGVYVGNGKYIKTFKEYEDQIISTSSEIRTTMTSEELVDNGYCLKKKAEIKN